MMIDLSAMIGRITGKSAESGVYPGASAGGEAGGSAASAGTFAALVQLVARTGQPAAPAEAGLVVETSTQLPDGAAAWKDGATADVPRAVLPDSRPVTSWTQFADTHVTPHKAAIRAAEGHPQGGPKAKAAADPASATTPGLPREADEIMASAEDEPIVATAAAFGDAPADPVLAADTRAMQASIPTVQSVLTVQSVPAVQRVPTSQSVPAMQSVPAAQIGLSVPIDPTAKAGAVVMAASTAGQKPSAVMRPSGSRVMVEAADGAGGPAPIATAPQIAMVTEARAKGQGKFSPPPAMPGVVDADGAVTSKMTGQTSDGTKQSAPGPTGPSGGRHSVLADAENVASPSNPGTAGAGGAMPLRMIVESLPPVVQSALTAGAVATVSGPSTGQQLGDQVIDMAVSGQWIDRMAREITALAQGGGHSRFTLNPPHLGRLQVDLWQGQEATSVRFIAETDEAARRLGEGRTALQTDARLVALNLGSVTIEKSALPHESPRESGGQRPGSDTAGQAQQQAGGQGHAQGQNQAKAGSGEAPGDRAGRPLRDDKNQQGDASPTLAARRAANGHVRFA